MKHNKNRSHGRGDRKTLQLCRQIERALSYALADCDDVTGSLYVQSVSPAPNAGRVLVLVASFEPDLTAAVVLESLERHAGKLRSEVAAAITRRKAPELAFQFVALKF